MPKTKTTSSKKKTQAKGQDNGSANAAEAKRAAREAQTATQMAYVVEHYVDGDESLSAVAKHLKITPGKAAFLAMQHRVAEGEVPAITGKTDEALLKAISKERNKADEYSSWGWLAARSGKSEGFIKTGLEALGLYTPKAENIASKRAESKPKATSSKTSGGKTSGKKKRVRGNA